jgi:hypothetical protein
MGAPIGAESYSVDSNEEERVTCPYCGESVALVLESDVAGEFVQDCEVCCNPWRVKVRRRGARRTIDVSRGDGSE